MLALVLNENLRLFESREEFSMEELVTQPPIEALIVPIFPEDPRCNVGRLHTEFVKSLHQFLR